MWLMIQCPIVLFIRGWISKFYFTTSQVSSPHRKPIALLPDPPTRFAGPLTQPDLSVATRHLPTLWGVTLPEGAFGQKMLI